MVRTIRLGMVSVWLSVTGMAWAQEAASALATFEQNAAKRNAEWSTLTTNLEQRIARLLPCDPRVRSAIEEVSRASDGRVAALNTYWMAAAGRSKSQTDAIRKLLAQEEGRKAEWTSDRRDIEQERATVAEQSGFLAVSANRVAGLAGAQQALVAAAQTMGQIETQVRARETVGEQLMGELRELLAASQTRQSAFEAQLKLIGAEGTRWNAYYAARLARGQTECAITNGGAAAPPAPARRAPTKAPEKKEDKK